MPKRITAIISELIDMKRKRKEILRIRDSRERECRKG